ncbi:tetratricopeptide repeat protein [Amycolatopsis sp. NBC_00345]|uniref:tetratricopeptide repeat protein n=1 Tax=Amycolatopsis sp. NBC_00345 TaxID=2975955 RepID=UPI002E25AB98
MANTVTGDVTGNVVMAGTIHDGVHIHLPARQKASLPYRYGTTPPRAASFQCRTIATDLAVAINPGRTAVLASDRTTSASVLSGLGGVGKTQLALDYAETIWAAREVDLLVWITATSRDAIVSDYARLVADLTGTEDTNPERDAQRLLAWLAATDTRWLLVLDDVQAPADLRGLWPPATPSGRVVVTTRRRDAALRGHGRRVIEVDVFTPVEAVTYLTGALADRPHLLDEVTELAGALGCLPAALAQAGAFMLDRDLSCAAYQERLADRRRQLASLLPEEEGLPDEHRATVAATWSLSIEHANRLEPIGIAGTLLEVASLLDPNGIPVDVFTAAPVLALLAAGTGRQVDAEQARDGLGCLHRLSLVTLAPPSDSEHRAVRVHALVQRATSDSLSQTRLPLLACAVADTLLLVWPEIKRSTGMSQMLRANTDALNEIAAECLWESGGHSALFRAGLSLGESGLAVQATDYFQRLHAAAVLHLGADHPRALAARFELALYRGQAGDPAGAVTALEELLADRLRVLGADHPDTLVTRVSLIKRRGQAGDPAGAVTALEELLADWVRVLGADHPHALITRHELAHWCGQAGDPAGAATAFEKLLADRVRVLGADHPDTLITRSNLAQWRGQNGNSASAVTELERLLADDVRVLGADHPHTLITRSNLAHWRGNAGDPAGAVAALQELLADQLRMFGADHPDTLITRNNLAQWRGQAGDPAGAVAALEELLADSIRVRGTDHPDVRITSANLAHWRRRLLNSPFP